MSTGSARNQTLSYLIRTFRRVGLEPSARHGQNFLIDLNLQRLLLDSAELGPQDVVLEVGPGLGSLTVDAVLNRDFPVIQGVVLFFSVLYVLINLLVDLSYLWLDPRIRY